MKLTFQIERGLHSSPAQQSPQADDGSIMIAYVPVPPKSSDLKLRPH